MAPPNELSQVVNQDEEELWGGGWDGGMGWLGWLGLWGNRIKKKLERFFWGGGWAGPGRLVGFVQDKENFSVFLRCFWGVAGQGGNRGPGRLVGGTGKAAKMRGRGPGRLGFASCTSR